MKSKSTWIILAALLLLFVAGMTVYLGYAYQILGSKVPETSGRIKPKSGTSTGTTSPSQTPGNVQPSTASADWVTYTNSRYGFRVDYPKAWQARQSQNGDGITVTVPGEDGVIFRAYGFATSTFSLAKLESDKEAAERSAHGDLAVIERREITIDERPAIEAIWTFSTQPSDSPLTGALRMHTAFTLKGESGYALEYIGEDNVYSAFDGNYTTMLGSFKLK